MSTSIERSPPAIALRPANPAELAGLIVDANLAGHTLEIVGGATKRGLGDPVSADAVLDLSALAGIVFYEPEELVVKVHAGTRLAELRETLAAQRQHLAFEPPGYAAFFGAEPTLETVGGVVACNLAGPRRVLAGSARDAVLGVEGVNGLGEPFKGGGRTVKNVTGYDIPRLMTGSFGVLAALTSVTLKVHPMPSFESTVVVEGLDDAQALYLSSELLRAPLEVSGAVHLGGARDTPSHTAFRLEGWRESVAARQQEIVHRVGSSAAMRVIVEDESRAFWTRQRDLGDFASVAQTCVWRLALPSNYAAQVVAGLGAEALYDWGGSRVFVAMAADAARECAAGLREAARDVGGTATLLRAPDALRRETGAFQPKSGGLDGLAERVRHAFDPNGVLNPGKLGRAASGDT
ncbi:FAD-binding protein [Paraburkholderia pallida]|uniref:FAD-binding protein n=1 Tax=Paraburkholderia pallida TaxID=2547399 RepID=A0A4P7D5P7_9BURK|nr:FAD-binding protein [Paraburkholderia pallida]QBR01934.1 FAD-binding protein [Paraburkholderia pallida]